MKERSLFLDQPGLDPLTQFIHTMLQKALLDHASDIHIEPIENTYRIRLRIDGILHEVQRSPLSLSNRLVSKLKITAGLDITEKRLPQEGQLSIIHQGKTISLRMSSSNTVHGEKIVLRILNKANLSLTELGMQESQLMLFKQSIHQPQGLILVCGPTGSGKTMTLYAALEALNSIHRNIISIEDPVEIYLPGINQINIHKKIGFDFGTALRSLLRQDPDIIMIGEIRDSETAEIAIKSAQTGHLVLATLHSNSSVKAISRLIHLGIHPFDLADSLLLIVSQRLIRLHCLQCQGKDCVHCRNGFSGRKALFEIVQLDPPLQQLITTNASSQRIETYLQENHFLTLKDSGALWIKNKLTSQSEINRVLGDATT